MNLCRYSICCFTVSLLSLTTLLTASTGVADDEDIKPRGFYEADVVTRESKFGRLFFTPEQRQQLDQFRQRSTANTDTDNSAELVSSQPPISIQETEVRLSGVIVRGDGKHMVWLNGRSQLSPQNNPGIKAGPPRADAMSVLVQTQQKSTILKPGQVWLVNERKVEEAYQVKKSLIKDLTPISDGTDPSSESAHGQIDGEN